MRIGYRCASLRFALAAALLALPVRAAEYRVAADGSDANDGIKAPWKSLQKAAAALNPGDTLTVLAGTYQLESAITLSGKRGTESAPVLIQAQGKAVLRDGAQKVAAWQGMFDVRNSSWITIRGFTLEQSGLFGVYINGADHITVERCATSESLASGVAAWNASNIVIRDNDIRAACNQGERIRGTTCQEHISLDHVQGFLIENNKVHDSPESGKAHWGGGEGIDTKNGTSHGIVRNNDVWNLVQVCIYVDAWRADITDIEIYGNRAHHCGSDGISINSEQTGNLSRIRVHDNVCYANGETGITVWRSKNNTIKDVQIYNNTVVDNGFGTNKPYFVTAAEKIDKGVGMNIYNPATTGLVLRDNIIYGNATAQLVVAAEIVDPVVENNLIGPSLGTGISGYHSVIADPMFVDAARFDFRLRPGSPAIDAGKGGPNLGKTDCWGNPRVAGKAVDIGAYETPAYRPWR
jgi:parallel beta-helix repeat protein